MATAGLLLDWAEAVYRPVQNVPPGVWGEDESRGQMERLRAQTSAA